MARGFNSYSAGEGVAVDGKFVRMAKRSVIRPDRDELLADALLRKQKYEAALMKDSDDSFKNTYHKTREGWLKEAQKDYERDVQTINQPFELNVVGMEGGSKERIEQLEQIRKNSSVKEIVFRGQEAYEVLDNKKAAQIVKEQNEKLRSYDKQKTTSMWARGGQGSRGDGLYHMTSDPTYADQFAFGAKDGAREKGGIVEGVIDSKHLLNLREFSDGIQSWYASHPDVAGEKAKHEKRYVNDFRPELDKNANRAFASALVDSIAKQYKDSFGKPLPEKAGVRKYDAENGYDAFKDKEPYKELKDAVFVQLTKKDSLGMMYMVMKMPFFKKLLKDTKFDTIAYMDYGDRPSYAVTSPTQFKSYYGDKPVNKKSPNMFDADPA